MPQKLELSKFNSLGQDQSLLVLFRLCWKAYQQATGYLNCDDENIESSDNTRQLIYQILSMRYDLDAIDNGCLYGDVFGSYPANSPNVSEWRTWDEWDKWYETMLFRKQHGIG